MNTKLARLAIILTMALAWLGASNHCALATIAAASAISNEHSCCHPDDPAPAPQTMTECCQALGAPLPMTAAAPVTQLFVLFPAWADAVAIVAPIAPVSEACGYLSNGPPCVGFTELVLNRSLLAHAPPFVVA